MYFIIKHGKIVETNNFHQAILLAKGGILMFKGKYSGNFVPVKVEG